VGTLESAGDVAGRQDRALLGIDHVVELLDRERLGRERLALVGVGGVVDVAVSVGSVAVADGRSPVHVTVTVGHYGSNVADAQTDCDRGWPPLFERGPCGIRWGV